MKYLTILEEKIPDAQRRTYALIAAMQWAERGAHANPLRLAEFASLPILPLLRLATGLAPKKSA
jgi:hypothetical protein